MADLGAVILRAVGALRGRGLPVLAMPALRGFIFGNHPRLSSWPRELFVLRADVSGTAGQWKTLLDLTGAGLLRGLLFTNSYSTQTAPKITLRITLDGRAYEETVSVTASISSSNMQMIGCAATSSCDGSSGIETLSIFPNGAFPFRRALKIEFSGNYNWYVTAYADYLMEASQ